jgi:hypothetical protein
VAAFQTLVEAVGTALRIAEPHTGACRTVEAIEIALRAETHRCKAEGQRTRADTYDRAAKALAGAAMMPRFWKARRVVISAFDGATKDPMQQASVTR